MPAKGGPGGAHGNSSAACGAGGGKSNGMTHAAADRIAHAEARNNGGQISSNGFASRAAAAATRNAQS